MIRVSLDLTGCCDALARAVGPLGLSVVLSGVSASQSSHSETAATVAPIPVIAQGARNADAGTQAIAAEIEALKLLVDGFGHALRGVANAQVRHEKQINALSSPRASPARPKARPSRNKVIR